MALKDQADLAVDTVFISRVRQALIAGAISIQNEAGTVPYHSKRAALATAVMNNPASYATLFAMAVATDATVAADAGSPATQASVTDAHINAAVAAVANAFFSSVG